MPKQSIVIVLGGAVLAATWLFIGPELMQIWGFPPTAISVLSYAPAMVVWFGSVKYKNFMRCEYSAWRRIFGK